MEETNTGKAATLREALLSILDSVQKLGLYAIIGPVLGLSLGAVLFVAVDKEHYQKTIELEDKIIALDEKATVMAQRELEAAKASHVDELRILQEQIRHDEDLLGGDKAKIAELSDRNEKLAIMLAQYAPHGSVSKEMYKLLLQDSEIVNLIGQKLAIAR